MRIEGCQPLFGFLVAENQENKRKKRIYYCTSTGKEEVGLHYYYCVCRWDHYYGDSGTVRLCTNDCCRATQQVRAWRKVRRRRPKLAQPRLLCRGFVVYCVFPRLCGPRERVLARNLEMAANATKGWDGREAANHKS